jgi:hypothetical protein
MKDVSQADRYPIDKVAPEKQMDAYLNSKVSPINDINYTKPNAS